MPWHVTRLWDRALSTGRINRERGAWLICWPKHNDGYRRTPSVTASKVDHKRPLPEEENRAVDAVTCSAGKTTNVTQPFLAPRKWQPKHLVPLIKPCPQKVLLWPNVLAIIDSAPIDRDRCELLIPRCRACYANAAGQPSSRRVTSRPPPPVLLLFMRR
jgi:hypothetical protein